MYIAYNLLSIQFIVHNALFLMGEKCRVGVKCAWISEVICFGVL